MFLSMADPILNPGQVAEIQEVVKDPREKKYDVWTCITVADYIF